MIRRSDDAMMIIITTYSLVRISARVMTEIMNTMKSIRKFAVNDASTVMAGRSYTMIKSCL